MARFRFPLLLLMEEAEAAMDNGVPHFFGARYRNHDSYPKYVWVPTRSRERNLSPTRLVEEYRSLSAHAEHVEIDCLGEDFDQTWALRQNLGKALHDLGLADQDTAGGEWVDPSESWNQEGELYRLEVSLVVPIIDAYVDLTTMEDPVQETFIPARIEGDIFKSPDVETDGELGVHVSTSP